MKNTIKLTIPDEVLEKIKYLCRVIPMVEWSGILLYDTTGSIQDPDNMVITLKDIILMNKGTATYTEYNFTEKKRDQSGYTDRHIDYCEENEEALFWQIGHIHSHNKMDVFFSQTDMAELDDNAPCYNYYLSLIVNNAMDFTAKVAFVATAEVEAPAKYIALNGDGEKYSVGSTILKAKKEKLFIFDCDIESNLKTLAPDNFFQRNLTEVLEEADKPKYSQKSYKPATSSAEALKPKPQVSQPTYFMDEEDFFDTLDNKVEVQPDIEAFVSCLINGTNTPDEETTFEDLLKNFKFYKVSGEDIARSVLDNYFALYEKFFEESVGDEKVFIEVTEEVIDYLEEYEKDYLILSATIMALKKVVEEFLKFEKI